MTEAQKLANRLRKAWEQTTQSNWDSIESYLKSAKKMINSGETDNDLVYTYLTISEAFMNEYGDRLSYSSL